MFSLIPLFFVGCGGVGLSGLSGNLRFYKASLSTAPEAQHEPTLDCGYKGRGSGNRRFPDFLVKSISEKIYKEIDM
jgi:hypothetical protein